MKAGSRALSISVRLGKHNTPPRSRLMPLLPEYDVKVPISRQGKSTSCKGHYSRESVTLWLKVFQEHNSKRMANVADREAVYLAQTAQLKAEGFSKEKVQEWGKAGSEYHKLLAQVNCALSLQDGSKSTVQFPPFTN